jgi:phosphoesterase RecJ-like protein
MGTSNTAGEVGRKLRELSRIVVVSHYNPDADAFGSSCGLVQALRDLGKTAVCVNESGPAPLLGFIPGVSEVLTSIPPGDWDAAVICDCGDFQRVGEKLQAPLRSIPLLINIDHHISNDRFGQLNFVVPESSSTSELIFEVLHEGGIPISSRVAKSLFTGLSADTGSFKYSSTSKRTFEVAASLTALGAEPAAVAQDLYGNTRLTAARLQAAAIVDAQLFADGRIAFAAVGREQYERFGATPDDVDYLVERLRDLEGVLVSAVMKQDGDIYRVSLRSKDPKYDVSSVATSFGGGGHRAAAAFRWRRTPDELRPALISALEGALRAS